MMNRTARNIRAHVGWAAAIFIPLVLLAIPLLPRVFGQPRTRIDRFATANPSSSRQTNQSPSHNVIKADQAQLLRYDVQTNPIR
jgi:hypothetical protein